MAEAGEGGIVSLAEYRDAIHLDEPIMISVSPNSLATDLNDSLAFLLKEYFDRTHHHHHHDEEHNHDADIARFLKAPMQSKLSLLRQLLTLRPAMPFPEDGDLLNKLDSVMQCVLLTKKITSHTDLKNIFEGLFGLDDAKAKEFPDYNILKKFSLWKGDITSLSIDCIVNAANNAMLGCFQPDHPCIDNAIHWQAGPRLRADCNEIMEMQGDIPEPVGLAKATRGYNLPSKFVLHTVGPQLPKGRNPTPEESKSLESSYWECMEVTEAIQGANSIAFCCISTGLFGFPQDQATVIAVKTVMKWLKAHPDSHIDHVVFNVFKADDEALYISEFEKIVGQPAANLPLYLSVRTDDQKLALAVKWVREATDVLVAAGAGLSASAGLDYGSEEVFKKHFPAMYKRGFRKMYQFIGFHDWTPALEWGYYMTQVNLARFNWPEHEVYVTLKKILFSKLDDEKKFDGSFSTENPFFVKTSNADGMFSQREYPAAFLWTPQGDYSRLQCLKPCRRDSIFPTKEFIEKALPFVDPETQEITEPSVIPVCRNCGGPVMMNVRGGDWFMEEPHLPQEEKFNEWLQAKLAPQNKRELVIIEIGAGFNTPSVLRYPNEELATEYSNVKLVRINAQHFEVPEDLVATKAIGLAQDAAQALSTIFAGLK
eukprot:TRINITY_DN4011_c0_g1_i1.p1 TRINITY_DN4011_c0_g1~~TRINITY_DN4011_c0_g1_i1.p1  ORF type:complete len:654 (+),score=166.46 TRINITY_DN4011_c0_g1_i1:230-2191(+)